MSDQKRPILLVYETPPPPPAPGPIPDGYLGHRASPDDLEDVSEQPSDLTELGPREWVLVAILTPFAVVGIIFLFLVRS